MRSWLAAVVGVPFAFAAHAQPSELDAVVTIHSTGPNFAIPVIPQFAAQSPLQDGMIAQEELAPNARVGLGLAPMLGRNIHSVRLEPEPVPTRNPGVSFVLRFPG